MLYIYGKRYEEQDVSDDVVLYPGATFDICYEDDWLNDPMVREFISEIQRIDVRDVTIPLEHTLLQHGMRIEDLCNGVKNLILCKYYNDEMHKSRMGMMGENCFKWLVRIAKERDVYSVTTISRLFTNEDIQGERIFFPDLNRYISNQEEYIEAILDLKDRNITD